ncbi:diamine N-acetyltransferase [Methylacidimicrobium cyclopophantes]|uniref:Diamine N-acetyltransferase n=2 Tax=Methylacidimicrobium cyclopophantes TaxID=1041766 RepID=A0A5E6MDF0_9BACT|nr:diamine N-acetyltransferase [Methylacidimicrobium cyclopophantes]
MVLERIYLRPLEEKDLERVRMLSGDPDCSWATRPITYPESVQSASSWLDEHITMTKKGKSVSLAVVLRDQDLFIGSVLLFLEPLHQRAEIGCWIGRPYWSRGYGTEACAGAIHHGFEVLRLHKVSAYCVSTNTGSLKMLAKLGMKWEGCLREHLKIRGCFEDLLVYGLLAEERTTAGF